MDAYERQPLPNIFAEITPAFLTAVLNSVGVLGRATRSTGLGASNAIQAVCVEPIAPGAYNAQLARLHLAYSGPTEMADAGQAPRTLIAKLPTADAALVENAAVFRPGAKECWFYQHGAVRTPVKTPRCYYSAVDTATGESILLLEDLAAASAGAAGMGWAQGASLEEAELALQAAARLHAAWWEVDLAREPELSALMGNLTAEGELVERLYQQGWPQFLERSPVGVPADVRRFGERLMGRIAQAEALLDGSPHTLTHGDFRLENVLFGLQDGHRACWVIDWEDVIVWNGMLDVAWFLGSGLRVADSGHEEALLRRYHRALLQAGIEDYAWDACWYDYRCAMIGCFVQGILSAMPPETESAHAWDLSRALGARFLAAAQRLHLNDLLPI